MMSSRNPFQGGMGFFTVRARLSFCARIIRRNPFQGGMGFFTQLAGGFIDRTGRWSQSLSGWDGVFHPQKGRAKGGKHVGVAIPFRVEWGFSPKDTMVGTSKENWSQSLSGWDGVFHRSLPPMSGRGQGVAIPFRVGWGFSREKSKLYLQPGVYVAIPFRVGWGFSL